MATATSITYLTATEIQGLMVFNYDDYAHRSRRWHGTLMMWALLFITYIINVFCIKLLPIIELLGGVCHVAFFVALLGKSQPGLLESTFPNCIIVPLITLAPRSTNDFVWKSSLNNSNGYSDGTSWCVGLLTVVYCFVGFDGAVHMSEEVRNAPKTIPKILMWTIAINGSMAFAFLIGLLYSIGDVDAALKSATGYPIIEIFYQATGSKEAATAMMAGIIIIAFASTFGIMASVSRLTWAFARDGGLPASTWFAHVSNIVSPLHSCPDSNKSRSIQPTEFPLARLDSSPSLSCFSPSSTSNPPLLSTRFFPCPASLCSFPT